MPPIATALTAVSVKDARPTVDEAEILTAPADDTATAPSVADSLAVSLTVTADATEAAPSVSDAVTLTATATAEEIAAEPSALEADAATARVPADASVTDPRVTARVPVDDVTPLVPVAETVAAANEDDSEAAIETAAIADDVAAPSVADSVPVDVLAGKNSLSSTVDHVLVASKNGTRYGSNSGLR